MTECINRIRLEMSKRNMSQAELSRLTGIAKSTLSTYFSGKISPKQSSVYKIAAALNVTPQYLLYGITFEETPEEQRLLAYFNLLNESYKNKAINSLKDIAGEYLVEKQMNNGGEPYED